MSISMERTIKELYRLFDLMNEHIFDNQLPSVQIVVTETTKQNAYGWFTPHKVWTNEDESISKHEIALSAEYLSLKHDDYLKIVETLLHEMIHLYCHVNEIKDTSRQGRYHNARFKKACEEHGLYFEIEKPDSTIGWSQALLTPQTKELIRSWDVDEEAFQLRRIIAPKIASKQSYIKYECPLCDQSVRGKRELFIKCALCDVEMLGDD